MSMNERQRNSLTKTEKSSAVEATVFVSGLSPLVRLLALDIREPNFIRVSAG